MHGNIGDDFCCVKVLTRGVRKVDSRETVEEEGCAVQERIEVFL